MRDLVNPLPRPAIEVLEFWFGDRAGAAWGTERPEWFRKDDAFDALIADRFSSLIEAALRGETRGWITPWGVLAQIVVLDQFTRNAFRGSSRSFAGDARALMLARRLVASRDDLVLPPTHRAFAYMPFEHAEDLTTQDESVQLFAQLAATNAASEPSLHHAERHRSVIARFGRFPHRNVILGRPSTPEETAFLQLPGSRF